MTKSGERISPRAALGRNDKWEKRIPTGINALGMTKEGEYRLIHRKRQASITMPALVLS